MSTLVTVTRLPILRRPQGYYLRWWYNGWHYWQFIAGGLTLETTGESYRTYGQRTITANSGQVNAAQIKALRTLLNTTEVYLLTADGWLLICVATGSAKILDLMFGGYELQISATIGSRLVSDNGYSPVNDIPTTRIPTYSPDSIIITTIIDGVFTTVITGEAGAEIVIDWGDGTPPETIVLTGGEQTITHDYTGSGGDEHTVTITGDLPQVTDLGLSGNEITDIILAENLTHLETLDVSDNNLTHIDIPPTLTELTELDISDNEFTEWPIIPDTVPIEILISDGNPFIICETVIGTQVWLCKNWDSAYPASKVYDNDEANRALFGGLYTFTQILNDGFVPEGWHIPKVEEWETLLDYVGGLAVAGGKLKALGTTYWNAPNTDADDAFGFNARGAGYIFNTGTGYIGKLTHSYLWAVGHGVNRPTLVRFNYDSGAVVELTPADFYDVLADNGQPISLMTELFASVRFIKNTPAPPPDMLLRDFDNNVYTTVEINGQLWTVENLRVKTYADGTPIPNITDNSLWNADVTGAYCHYGNDAANEAAYGLLYNWYALNNGAVLPYFKRNNIQETDWRIPTDADFIALVAYLGGISVAGGKLKEVGTVRWTTPNTDATDDYGFKAVPSGYRYLTGGFFSLNEVCELWSATEIDATQAKSRLLSYNLATFPVGLNLKGDGFAIRCVKNISI